MKGKIFRAKLLVAMKNRSYTMIPNDGSISRNRVTKPNLHCKNVLLSMTWDFRGIIRYGPLPSKRTITVEYCQNRSTNLSAAEVEMVVYRTRNERRNFATRRCSRIIEKKRGTRFLLWDGKCCHARHTLQAWLTIVFFDAATPIVGRKYPKMHR